MISDKFPDMLPYITHFPGVAAGAVAQDEALPESDWGLVRKGDLLVSLRVPPCDSASGGRRGREIVCNLVAGDCTELLAEDKGVAAAVDGYPRVAHKKVGETHTVSVSLIPLIHVSADGMFAFLNLYPCTGDEYPLSADELTALLKQEKIVYGIDAFTLEDCLELYKKGTKFQPDIVIARGIRPLDGSDASLRFAVEVGPFAGEMLRNGRIDYRERKIFVGVSQDQLIATKIAASAGTPGRNIYGEELPQRPGRDIKFLASGDVWFSEDTGEVRAKLSGVVSVINGKKIQVSGRKTLSGNVDYATGNIESKGALEIRGGVQPGFTVETKGDILITKNLTSATVNTQANATIQGGAIGETGSVTARGDIDIKFIERATINAGGDVIVHSEAYYSELMAEGSILCDEGSKVLGGLLVGGVNVFCGNIGSDNSEPAVIAAGVSGHRYKLIISLQEKREKLQGQILEMHQLYGAKAHDQKKYLSMTQEFEKISEKLCRTNLIPLAPQGSRGDPMRNYTNAEIIVHGIIKRGTVLQIGNIRKELDEDRSRVRFHLDLKQKEIIGEHL